jgi:GNAT superfamily N-acetyltransferase
MTRRFRIALAKPDHVSALAAIELEAAALLTGHAPASVLEDTTPASEFLDAQREGRLWVALVADRVVGFAHATLHDERPHLEEMDVLPQYGQCGIGSALLRQVIRWVDQTGADSVTLTTFRSVPWNMPFYAKHGFEVLPPTAWSPAIEALVTRETARGLDRSARVVMRRECHTTVGAHARPLLLDKIPAFGADRGLR